MDKQLLEKDIAFRRELHKYPCLSNPARPDRA